MTQHAKNYLLSTTVAISILSTMTAALVAYENNQLKSDIVIIVKDVSNRQNVIDKLISSNKSLDEELFWCKHVNGELIQKCNPSTVNSVIKKTPLPPLETT